MNKVEMLRKQITDAMSQIKQIQSECTHPKSCLKRESHGSHGNYDPSADRYWYEFHCELCGKRWTEDQK